MAGDARKPPSISETSRSFVRCALALRSQYVSRQRGLPPSVLDARPGHGLTVLLQRLTSDHPVTMPQWDQYIGWATTTRIRAAAGCLISLVAIGRTLRRRSDLGLVWFEGNIGPKGRFTVMVIVYARGYDPKSPPANGSWLCLQAPPSSQSLPSTHPPSHSYMAKGLETKLEPFRPKHQPTLAVG